MSNVCSKGSRRVEYSGTKWPEVKGMLTKALPVDNNMISEWDFPLLSWGRKGPKHCQIHTGICEVCGKEGEVIFNQYPSDEVELIYKPTKLNIWSCLKCYGDYNGVRCGWNLVDITSIILARYGVRGGNRQFDDLADWSYAIAGLARSRTLTDNRILARKEPLSKRLEARDICRRWLHKKWWVILNTIKDVALHGQMGLLKHVMHILTGQKWEGCVSELLCRGCDKLLDIGMLYTQMGALTLGIRYCGRCFMKHGTAYLYELDQITDHFELGTRQTNLMLGDLDYLTNLLNVDFTPGVRAGQNNFEFPDPNIDQIDLAHLQIFRSNGPSPPTPEQEEEEKNDSE